MVDCTGVVTVKHLESFLNLLIHISSHTVLLVHLCFLNTLLICTLYSLPTQSIHLLLVLFVQFILSAFR